MSDKNILIVLLGTFTVALAVLLANWHASCGCTRYSPEAREKAFQSELAECDRLAELNGNDWRLKLAPDDTCAAVFEEYSRRIDEEEKRQAIDETEKQSISDGAAPEPQDTE